MEGKKRKQKKLFFPLSHFPAFLLSRLLAISLSLFFCEVGVVPADVKISDYRFGFNKNPKYYHYKQNAWTPLQVFVESVNEEFDGKVKVETVDLFSGAKREYSASLSLSRVAKRRLYFYVFLSGIASKLKISLIETSGREKDSKEFVVKKPKRSQDFLILALTPNVDTLSYLAGKRLKGDIPSTDTPAGEVFVSYLAGQSRATDGLPPDWKGYDSLSLLVIRDISLEPHRISKRQQNALIEWILSGGTLLVSGSSQYLNNSFLEPYLPVVSLKQKTINALPSLAKLFGITFKERFVLTDSRLSPKGNALVMEGDIPIIAERELGDGKIVFLAFDYSLKSFAIEHGGEKLWDWLLNDAVRSKLKRKSPFDPFREHERRIGGLLKRAPANIIRSPLLRFLGIFLATYVIASVSVSCIFARKARSAKKIWLSQLCVILGFSIFPIFLNYVTEPNLTLNSFSMLSIYPEFGKARLNTYFGLLSSDNSKQDIKFNSNLFLNPLSDIRRKRMPISDEEGSDSVTSGFEETYEFLQGKEFELEGVQLNPWMVQTFHAESHVDWKDTVEFTPLQTEGVISGTIRNSLPFDLENAYITYGEFYKEIGVLKRGVEVNVTIDRRYSDDVSRAVSVAMNLLKPERRKAFAGILFSEGLLRYLNQPLQPKLIGWTQTPIINLNVKKGSVTESQSLVIIHLAIR